MKLLSKQRYLWWVVLVLGTLALGALGGTVVSGLLRQRDARLKQADREELRKAILGKMQALRVGDTLKDHEFDDLSGQTFLLSSLVRGGAIISIISPDCMACAEEVTDLAKKYPDTAVRNRFIFVSDGNVEEFENFRRVSGLANLFLYDRRSAWLSKYKVPALPMNIIVDNSLRVRKLIPFAMLPSDIDEFRKQSVATNLTITTP